MQEFHQGNSWPGSSLEWTAATAVMATARECMRSLWNEHYRHLTNNTDPFDVVDAYKAVRSQVLQDYLCLSCGNGGTVFAKIKRGIKPQHVFRKIISAPQIVTWEPLENSDYLEGEVFMMADFFDFGDRNLIELRYVEIDPVDLQTLRPDNTRRVLAEFDHCEFWIRIDNHRQETEDA